MKCLLKKQEFTTLQCSARSPALLCFHASYEKPLAEAILQAQFSASFGTVVVCFGIQPFSNAIYTRKGDFSRSLLTKDGSHEGHRGCSQRSQRIREIFSVFSIAFDLLPVNSV